VAVPNYLIVEPPIASSLSIMLVVQVNVKEGRIEKWIMRKAFDDKENPYLPKVRVYGSGHKESVKISRLLPSW
jgi:hypothetical protein